MRARLVSFNAVGTATARAKKASNIEMNRQHIVNERAVEALMKIGEDT